MKYVLGIDSGTTETAYCLIEESTYKPIVFAKENNEKAIYNIEMLLCKHKPLVAIECIQSYGMAVGKTVFETCYFIGKLMRLCEENKVEYTRVYRSEEKLTICHSLKANDSTIRQALIDRFGVVGTKKNQGFFYGFKKDIWSAFAICVTALERDLYIGNGK